MPMEGEKSLVELADPLVVRLSHLMNAEYPLAFYIKMIILSKVLYICSALGCDMSKE